MVLYTTHGVSKAYGNGEQNPAGEISYRRERRELASPVKRDVTYELEEEKRQTNARQAKWGHIDATTQVGNRIFINLVHLINHAILSIKSVPHTHIKSKSLINPSSDTSR